MSSETGKRSPFKIFRNFGSLTAGKVLGDVFTFLFFVTLSRAYGQEGLGYYSFATALSGFFVVFADFGLYYYSVKDMSRQAETVSAYYGRIFALRLVLSLAVMAVVLLALPVLPFPFEQKIIIGLVGAYQVFYTLVDGFSAVFVAREDMHIAGAMEFSGRMVAALASIAVVLSGGSLVAAVSVMPVVSLLQIVAAYLLVARKYGPPRPVFSLAGFRTTLKESFPFALFRLLSQVATRMDVLLLGVFLGAAAVGVYNAAYRVVFLLMFLAFFASMALFPQASRLHETSKEELDSFYHRSLRMIIIASLPISAGVWLVAPDIVQIVYGEAFAESARILRYLSWIVFFAFLQNVLGTFLTATDRQVDRTRGQWTAAWVNLLGNLALIPLLGIQGAAIATVFSEGLLVVVFMLQLKKNFGLPKVAAGLGMSAAGAVAFCLPFIFFSSLPIFIVVPASMLLYTGTLFLFKEFRSKEGRLLLSILHKGGPLEA